AGQPGPGRAAGSAGANCRPGRRHRPARWQARARLQPGPWHRPGDAARKRRGAGAGGQVLMIGIVALNLGGPDGPEAVEPFLRNLFGDPDVIQLGWARPLQPLLARAIARRRAPESQKAYDQIGGRSPIRAESEAQAGAVADVLARRNLPAR